VIFSKSLVTQMTDSIQEPTRKYEDRIQSLVNEITGSIPGFLNPLAKLVSKLTLFPSLKEMPDELLLDEISVEVWTPVIESEGCEGPDAECTKEYVKRLKSSDPKISVPAIVHAYVYALNFLAVYAKGQVLKTQLQSTVRDCKSWIVYVTGTWRRFTYLRRLIFDTLVDVDRMVSRLLFPGYTGPLSRLTCSSNRISKKIYLSCIFDEIQHSYLEKLIYLLETQRHCIRGECTHKKGLEFLTMFEKELDVPSVQLADDYHNPEVVSSETIDFLKRIRKDAFTEHIRVCREQLQKNEQDVLCLLRKSE
jgi:hypothetical protein